MATTALHYQDRDHRDPMNDELNGAWAADVLAREHVDEPFMLCLGIGRPQPLIAPQEYFDLFPLDDIELSPQILANDVEDCAQSCATATPAPTTGALKIPPHLGT